MKRYKSRYKPFSIKRSEKRVRQRLFLSIIIIAVFGFALISWILPTFIGGLSVLNQFKTTSKITEPIEDTTIAPPVLNIPYEATNSAAISIKGYAQSSYFVEIYLDDELKSTTKAREDGSFISDPIELNIGSNFISGKAVNLEDKKSLSSKPIKVVFDNEKPTLEINSPSDNQETKEKKFTVSGLAETQDEIDVRVNNFRVIVQADGKYSYTLELSEGENIITVTATDGAGNSSQLTRRLVYQP